MDDSNSVSMTAIQSFFLGTEVRFIRGITTGSQSRPELDRARNICHTSQMTWVIVQQTSR